MRGSQQVSRQALEGTWAAGVLGSDSEEQKNIKERSRSQEDLHNLRAHSYTRPFLFLILSSLSQTNPREVRSSLGEGEEGKV